MHEGRKIWHWLILAVLSVIWGTSYILMKKGLESFSTLQIGSLRMLIASVCLAPVAFRHLSKLNRDNILSVTIIGFFGSGIPAFLFPLAQTRISSSLAGMLNSLSPVFTLIIGIMFYGRKAIKSQIAGVFLGLIGALGLLYSGPFTLNYFGLFVVLATLLYGISSNEVSRVQGINGLQITSLAFLVLAPFAAVLFISTDYQAAFQTEHCLRNFGFIVILSVFGSAVSLALFYLLIRETSPVFASMVTYFIPIIATIWGFTDNEHFTYSMMVSVIVIFAGVYLINRRAILGNLRKVLR